MSEPVTSKKQRCFVISPIGAEDSPVRRRANQFFKFIVCAALEERFTIDRADHGPPGVITNQIFAHLVEDELVVADLSGHNANVFYELAIRHLLRKPYVQLIATGERIPFDVASAMTIHFDITDLDSVEEAKNRLVKNVAIVMADGFEPESPLSAAIDLQSLRKGDVQQRAFADLLTAVGDIGKRMQSLEVALGQLRALAPSRRSQDWGPTEVFGSGSMKPAGRVEWIGEIDGTRGTPDK